MAVVMLVLNACSTLQNPSLISREGLASAAVLLAAVSALPDVPSADLAATLAAAMWPELRLQHSGHDRPPAGRSQDSMNSRMPTNLPTICNGQRRGSPGILGQHLQGAGTTLAARLAGMEPLSRVCAVKGLVSVLPLPTLCTPLPLQPPSSGKAPDVTATADSQAAPPSDRQQQEGRVAEPRSFPALDQKFAGLGGQDNACIHAAGPGSMAVPGRHRRTALSVRDYIEHPHKTQSRRLFC